MMFARYNVTHIVIDTTGVGLDIWHTRVTPA